MQSREELLETIAEVAGVGGWELDPATSQVVWTAHTRAIHEVTDDFEPNLSNALDFYPSGSRERITAAVEAAIASATPYDIEIEIVTAKGRRIWVRAVGRPILKDGSVSRVVGTFQDVTAIREERRALAAAVAAAEAANVAKSQFLATMSHEIRTPMNGVIGMLDLMKIEGVSEKQGERLRVARQSADVLLVLLNDILDLSKLEADKVAIEAVPMNLDETITGVLDLFAPTIEKKGLRLQRPSEAELDHHVIGDPVRLRQIVSNLVGNAVKFTSEGTISIDVQYEDFTDQLSVSVSDTGIGIPPEQLDRLFEPFTQADLTTTRRFGGTGLGLSISRRLARLMDGDIRARSTLGEGATFELSVPLRTVDEQVLSVSLPQPIQPTVDAGPLKILVAEDNTVNQMLVTALLEADRHEVTIVEDGAKAVAAIGEAPFDIVLMDIQMPVMDGIQATKEIRARQDAKAQVPIVALTANAMIGDRETFLAAGMDDYLAKPIDAAALKDLLATYRPASLSY